jgi:hypothetical protein
VFTGQFGRAARPLVRWSGVRGAIAAKFIDHAGARGPSELSCRRKRAFHAHAGSLDWLVGLLVGRLSLSPLF